MGEEQAGGTLVGRVGARDRDAPPYDEFRYECEEGCGGKELAGEEQNQDQVFVVDGLTGEIRTMRVLDRETRDEYTLRIYAIPLHTSPLPHTSSLMRNTDKRSPLEIDDGRTLHSVNSMRKIRAVSTSVVVRVLDVNDNSPEFESASIMSLQVSSASPPGCVTHRLQAKDRDTGANGWITYHIAAHATVVGSLTDRLLGEEYRSGTQSDSHGKGLDRNLVHESNSLSRSKVRETKDMQLNTARTGRARKTEGTAAKYSKNR